MRVTLRINSQMLAMLELINFVIFLMIFDFFLSPLRRKKWSKKMLTACSMQVIVTIKLIHQIVECTSP